MRREGGHLRWGRNVPAASAPTGLFSKESYPFAGGGALGEVRAGQSASMGQVSEYGGKSSMSMRTMNETWKPQVRFSAVRDFGRRGEQSQNPYQLAETRFILLLQGEGGWHFYEANGPLPQANRPLGANRGRRETARLKGATEKKKRRGEKKRHGRQERTRGCVGKAEIRPGRIARKLEKRGRIQPGGLSKSKGPL